MTKAAEKEQACELRRRGKSMKEIAREVGVSLGSVHLWTSEIDIGPEHRARLAENGHQRNLVVGRAKAHDWRLREVLQDRDQADAEWPSLRSDPAFVFGLALYIGEGDKTGTTVGMSNADPAVLRTTLRFFERIGVAMGRVRATIILHQGEDPTKALRYWSEELGLPQEKFYKVVPSKVSGGKRARHLLHGTVRVKVSAYRIKRKINRWMELARITFGPKIRRDVA